VSSTGPNESDVVTSPTIVPWERSLFWAALIFLGSQGLFLLRAPDLGLHIVVGEYTFQNGLPDFNVFSPVNSEHPIVQHEWAFQVLTYGIVSLLGMNGLSWVRLLVVLMLGVVMHRTLVRGRGYLGAVLCLALGLFVAHQRFVWRPELFSMIFLAVEFKLLIDFIEDRRDRLILLPIVFAVWVNFHGYFLVGLIVGGCFVVGECVEAVVRGRSQERATRLMLIGLLCIAATLVNPYFIEGAIYPIKLLIKLFTVDSQFTATIGELQPPHFFPHFWSVKGWYPLLAVFALTCLAMQRNLRFSYLLTVLAIWVMARSTFRNIGLYGMTLGLFAAVQWQTRPVWEEFSTRIAEFLRRTLRWRTLGVIAVLLSGAIFVATNRLYYFERVPRTFGSGVASQLVSPARQFIDENIPIDAQVFNTFDLGSRYLWWFYPERRPFIDGNGDGYPPEFYQDYLDFFLGQRPFSPYAKRHGIDWLYLNLKSNLARVAYHSPAWYPVYLDGDGVIFVSQSPKFAGLRKTINLRRDLALGHIPNWTPTPLPTLLRQRVPSAEDRLARFLFAIGEKRAAWAVAAHSMRFRGKSK